MPQTAYMGFLLILANVIISYQGFRDATFFGRYAFDVEKISLYKDYKRLVTSGFLHTGWLHLIFNMLALYFFSSSLEMKLGSFGFLLIYFASLTGGNLLALYIHRLDSGYSAVGASGAVCGIVFASIAISPGMEIGLFPLPIAFPAWLYGLAFVAYTIYSIHSRKNNTGHDAHLGGALTGMLVAIILRPSAVPQNYVVILLLAVPCFIFLYLLISRPHLLLTGNLFTRKKKQTYTPDQRYNAEQATLRKEIDAILEKIHQKGMNSLTKREKEKLTAYSRMET